MTPLLKQFFFQKTDANYWKSIYTVVKSDAIFFHRDKGTSGGNEQVDY